MKRQRIVISQTKEPITIPHPEKLPEFEPIIDPNSPKVYPILMKAQLAIRQKNQQKPHRTDCQNRANFLQNN